jgi:hypothetical protein
MKIRPYMDHDWQSVLDICILAFTPIHQSFENLLGTDLFRLVYPDWKASHERYLRSLTNAEQDRLLVAEENGSAVGFIHYDLSPDGQSGKQGSRNPDVRVCSREPSTRKWALAAISPTLQRNVLMRNPDSFLFR